MRGAGPVAAAAVALALAASSCSGGGGPGAGPATSTTAPSPSPPGGAAPSSPTSPSPTPPGAAWTTPPTVALTEVARVEGAPVALAARPGTGDLYVADQGGLVHRLAAEGDGPGAAHRLDPEPALDLTDRTRRAGEQGLLGLAFDPTGSHLYADLTDLGGDTRVVGWAMAGDRPDPATARDLLVVDQPFANHNGGQLAFGPDGLLYIGLGDGGGAGDPDRRAQDLDDLLGKVLRIDPRPGPSGAPYTVPADNPWVGGGGAPEVWLSGVRNPWRFSFDRATGDLWIGDVGQGAVEEVDRLPATGGVGAGRGADLGWSAREGTEAFRGEPAPPGAVDPVYEYANAGQDCAVTGGYVYRGTAVPELVGTYVFGDYCAGRLRGLSLEGGRVRAEGELGAAVPPGTLASFGEDLAGELYVLSTAGTVYRVDPAQGSPP